ncbi:hypothetical protein DLAC_00730 [Tieghemostelium lacteum]|uniref:F-box domain-containing protein n=1 Tax=Tieghemostelium lacteum TaxID=361077 RepID=A0A152A6U7_TIELA|nr:hypothetical protein DLAC_00730 [Tieghemostelium lacteum]|eukprot:KYR01940.1 hypothetical protein DLAC_00730 [Tieghemostelium lacteum]
MTSFRLPNICLFKILNLILDIEYLPLKYKLSLCSISKSVFQYISKSQFTTLNLLKYQNIQCTEVIRHLSSPQCAIQYIYDLKLNIDTYSSTVKEHIRAIDKLKNYKLNSLYIIQKNYNFTLNLSDLSPLVNLKELTINVTDLISCPFVYFDPMYIPKITKLNLFFLRVSVNSQLIPNIIQLLKQVEQSIEDLYLFPGIRNNQLYQFLKSYAVGRLVKLRMNSYVPLDLLLNQKETLQDLDLGFVYQSSFTIQSSILEFIDQNQTLHTVSVSIGDSKAFNAMVRVINSKKNILHLSIRYQGNGHSTISSQDGAGYLVNGKEEFEFTHLHSLALTSDYHVIESFLISLSRQTLSTQSTLKHIDLKHLNFINCFVLPTYSLNYFLARNGTITKLEYGFNTSYLTESESEIISHFIANSKVLQEIIFNIYQFQNKLRPNKLSPKQTKLFSKLHESPTLQYIEIKLYSQTSKPLNKIKHLPKHPFILVKKTDKSLCFDRYGVDYDHKPSTIPTSTNNIFKNIKNKILKC